MRSAAAAAAFAAVLLAGACSSSTKSTAAGAPAQTSSAQTSSPAAAPVTVTSTVTSGSSAPSSAAGSSSGGGQATTAPSSLGGTSAPGGASGSACQASNLKVTIIHGTDADPDPSKSNDPATVSFQNTGQSSCTMQGHPQVDLMSTSGTDWQLQNQSGDVPKLTLKPGDSALASLYVLSHTDGAGTNGFQVKSAVITPPDTKTATTVAWPWSWALEDQSGATHSGTYMGAVSQTASS